MELLKLLDNSMRAVPLPHLTDIPEFKAVIDKGKNAQKELAYVYHMSSFESAYSRLGSDLRSDKIIQDLFDGDWQPDDITQEAIDKYKELNKTIYTDLAEAADDAIHKLTAYFKTVNLTELDQNNKPIWSAKDLIANVSKVGDIVMSHKKLMEQIERDQASNSRNRRGINVNTFSE